MPASQDDQLRKARRLDYIEGRLATFARAEGLVPELAQEWDLSERSVRGYVTEVKERMKLRSRARTGVRRRQLVRAQEAVADAAMSHCRFGDATRAIQEIAKLEGLHDRAPEDDDHEEDAA